MATKATINGHQYHSHQRHRHQHHRHQLWTKTSFLWIATHLIIYKFLYCASSFEVHDHIWLKSQNYENFTQLFKSQIVPVHRQHWRLVVKLNLFFNPDPNIIPPNMIHFLVWFKFVLKCFQFFHNVWNLQKCTTCCQSFPTLSNVIRVTRRTVQILFFSYSLCTVYENVSQKRHNCLIVNNIIYEELLPQFLLGPLPLLVGNIGRGPGGLEVITYQEFDLRRVWHWQQWGGGMRRG